MSPAAASVNAFTFDVYRQIASEPVDANIILSPLSIASCLSLALPGARGTTAAEMRRVLHLTDDEPDSCPDLLDLLRALQPQDSSPQAKQTRAEVKSLLDRRRELRARNGNGDRVRNGAYEREEDARLTAQINEVEARLARRTVSIANAIWVERTLPFRRSYLARLDDCFDNGAMHQADFRHQPEAECGRINAWIAHETHGEIPNLLPSGSVSPVTDLILANAIFFEAEWEHPYDRTETSELPFHLFDGSESTAFLMMRRHPSEMGFGAFRGDGSIFATPTRLRSDDFTTPRVPGAGGFYLVDDPYRGGDLSMVLLVPIDVAGLTTIERLLDAEHLDAWLAQLTPRSVRLELPRFQLEMSRVLNPTLAALGMAAAFDPSGADFSGLFDESERSAGKSNFSVWLVQHRATIKVNEQGTRAAAATALRIGRGLGAPEWIDYIPEVRANHPFFFALRDRANGTLLFVGRVTRPLPP